MKTKAEEISYLTPHQYLSSKPQEEVVLDLERPDQVFSPSVSLDSPSPYLSLAHKRCTASTIVHFPAAAPATQTSNDPLHGESQEMPFWPKKLRHLPAFLKSGLSL